MEKLTARPRIQMLLRRYHHPLLLGLVLVAALALRLYGLDWDQGNLFHPDERAILMKVSDLHLPEVIGQAFSLKSNADVQTPTDRWQLLQSGLRELRSPESLLNPHWFPYGSLPLYLLKFLGFVLFQDPSLHELALLGRVLSVLFDTGTVLLVYLLALRLYSRFAGLLWLPVRGVALAAATLTAFAVLHIQLSHFYAVDSILTFFIVLTFLFLVELLTRGAIRYAVLAGCAFGLALATKVSAFPLAATFLAAGALYTYGDGLTDRPVGLSRPHRLRMALMGLAAAFVVAFLVFAIAQPYTFIDWRSFIKDVVEQSEMVRRVRDYPYTRQYIGTPAYQYLVQQLTVWGLGLPLGVLAWAGLAFTTVRGALLLRKDDLLMLSWVLPYFLITGSFQVKFLRYLLPITPFLLLMGTTSLFQLREYLAYGKPWETWPVGWRSFRIRFGWLNRALGKVLTPRLPEVALGIVIVASIAYSVAYVNIYTQPHPAIQVSEWVKANVPLGSRIVKEHWEEWVPKLEGYWAGELQLYDDDNVIKQQRLIQQLSETDYIAFYSNRLYGTIPRLPDRYPMTSRFYQRLFDGNLGFELVSFSTVYPNLFGVSLEDSTFTRAGLSLPVPGPLQGYCPTRWCVNLGYADESFTVYDHPKVMLFKKVQPLSQDALRELLPVSSEGRRVGLVYSEEESRIQQQGGTWSLLFSRASIQNRVPAIAWILLIELIALLAFPLAFTVFRFLPDRGYLFAKPLGILLVAYVPWLLSSLRWLPFDRLSIAIGMLVLGLASTGLYWWQRRALHTFLRQNLRLMMAGEMLFLGAFLAFYLLRLANPDLWHPWRGGEKPMDFAYLNAVVKSTFMPPYDPWFAGGYLNYYYFGQFITATLIKLTGIVPSVAYNLAVPLFFAVTVAGAFSLAFNLAALVRQSSSPRILGLPSPIWAGLMAAAFVAVIANLDGLVQLLQGLRKVQVLHLPFPPFDFWRSSRLMPPQISITEFPFFTFLFADLHAHLISIPFYILALSLGLNVALSQRGTSTWFPPLFALSLPLGALRVINTWDYPSFLLLSLVAIVMGEVSGRGRMDGSLVLRSLGKMALLYLLTRLWFLPFDAHYEAFYSGVKRSEEITPLYQYLEIHGLFVFAVVSFLIFELVKLWKTSTSGQQLGMVVYLETALVFALILFLGLGLQTVAFLFFLLCLLLPLAVKELKGWSQANLACLFLLGIVALALDLGLGVDLVTVKGDINRMNTVFKFYLQAWVLLAIGAAYAIWYLRLGMFLSGKSFSAPRAAWMAILALLAFGSSVYTVAATPERLKDRFTILPLTPDGMAYMARASYSERAPIELGSDYQAIRWMQDSIPGSPVVLEGVAPIYHWGSRISIYTGLPAVVGWQWHQEQQREGYSWAVGARIRDVETMYNSTNWREAQALMQRYRVRYIYIGELERQYYNATGLAKFEDMVGQGIELVYPEPQVENSQVRIYKVTTLSP